MNINSNQIVLNNDHFDSDKFCLMEGELPEESFFNIFRYDSMMHDACDHNLVYFYVFVVKDIAINNKIVIKKGHHFEQVRFDFKTQKFYFETYMCDEETGESKYLEHVIIDQNKLAPLLKWG